MQALTLKKQCPISHTPQLRSPQCLHHHKSLPWKRTQASSLICHSPSAHRTLQVVCFGHVSDHRLPNCLKFGSFQGYFQFTDGIHDSVHNIHQFAELISSSCFFAPTFFFAWHSVSRFGSLTLSHPSKYDACKQEVSFNQC